MKRTYTFAAMFSLLVLLEVALANESPVSPSQDLAAQQPANTQQDDVYQNKWNAFLREHVHGVELGVARSKLAEVSQFIGFELYGGTGAAMYVYRIDDFNEVILVGSLTEVQTTELQPRRNWRKLPDGTVMPGPVTPTPFGPMKNDAADR